MPSIEELAKALSARRRNAPEDGVFARFDAGEKKADDTGVPPEDHTLRNVAMAGAAALPFAGLIGQRPMIHDGAGKAYADYERFKQRIRPGDILVSGRPGVGSAKLMISLATGTPKGYHVAIAGPRRGTAYQQHPSGGYQLYQLGGPGEHMQVLRLKGLSPQQRSEFVRTARRRVDQQAAFEHALAKRIRAAARGNDDFAKALHGQNARELAEAAGAGTYAKRTGIKAGIKDLFLPKSKRPDEVAATAAARASRTDSLAKHDDLAENVLARMRAEHAQGADITRPKVLKGLLRRTAGNCVGDVCSTFPATVLGPKKALVPGKDLHEMLPSDWLRSNKVRAVAQYSPQEQTLANRALDTALRAAPTAIRAATGLGLAGGVYALSNYLAKRRQKSQTTTPQAAQAPVDGVISTY